MSIFGFALNEYVDFEIDRASSDLAAKPLVKGSVPKNHALIIAWGSLIVACVLAISFFSNLLALTVFTICIALAGVYDLVGKRLTGVDFLLGGWAFFFCLFGCYAVVSSTNFLGYAFALLFLLQWWYANIVEGGVKDADHDFAVGAKTTTTFWNVRVNGKKLLIPSSYKIFGLVLTVAYICMAWLPFAFSILAPQFWQLGVLLLLCGLIIYAVTKFLSVRKFKRDVLLKYILINELSKAFIPPIILVSLIGISAIFMIIFIVVWSGIFMTLEYGASPPTI